MFLDKVFVSHPDSCTFLSCFTMKDILQQIPCHYRHSLTHAVVTFRKGRRKSYFVKVLS